MQKQSDTFHQTSKGLGEGHPPIPKDTAQWPSEWKTTYYKDYPRLEKIPLPRTNLSVDFATLVKNRKSQRNFTKTPIGIEDLSTLLAYSCGITGTLKDGRHARAHPSGGARFPIEIYPVVLYGKDSLKPGLYHYNIAEHALDMLLNREAFETKIPKLFLYKWAKDASVVFVMTGIFSRSQHKYGERGYRYILLEAGHIGQNVYLVSEALQLKCCGLGGTSDKTLETLIDIDGISESVVYAVAVGV